MTSCARTRFLVCGRGTAAVEFALILPFLLAVVGGLVDFGFVFFDQCKLAAAVTAGSQYAFSQGQLNQTAQAADVRSKVQNALALTGATVPLPSPPTLKCVTRNTTFIPPTTSFNSQAITAGQTCASGNLPGTYMTITATFIYTPIMPFYSHVASTTLQEIAYVRLF
jgi:Flp pilus assembly protein TadG